MSGQFSNCSRRHFLRRLGAFSTVAAVNPLALHARGARSRRDGQPSPVILATDIGDDIDDTWALGLLLRSPELDLKLVLGDYGKSRYRAHLLAKLLQTLGHGHVPIGIGLDIPPHGNGAQASWLGDYSLRSYPGPIHADGVQALIDGIMKSPQPVTVISIGPMPNIAKALEREPRIAHRARFVGMDGSIRRGYEGDSTPCAEWNVKADPKAAQQGLGARWPVTITPLDTCGLVKLDGSRYAAVRDSKDLFASTIVENYRIWSKNSQAQPPAQPLSTATPAEYHSSTLFDTVAVYLACAHEFCRMETLRVRVTDDGFTRVDKGGKKMRVATGWTSLDAFEDLLVHRLTKAGHGT